MYLIKLICARGQYQYNQLPIKRVETRVGGIQMRVDGRCTLKYISHKCT